MFSLSLVPHLSLSLSLSRPAGCVFWRLAPSRLWCLAPTMSVATPDHGGGVRGGGGGSS